ncbi:hypothetical protein EOM09_02770, partial [bacterium]|nr:hypothetical protein [bacterium]
MSLDELIDTFNTRDYLILPNHNLTLHPRNQHESTWTIKTIDEILEPESKYYSYYNIEANHTVIFKGIVDKNGYCISDANFRFYIIIEKFRFHNSGVYINNQHYKDLKELSPSSKEALWLDACIKHNKYISKEEALKVAESVKSNDIIQDGYYIFKHKQWNDECIIKIVNHQDAFEYWTIKLYHGDNITHNICDNSSAKEWLDLYYHSSAPFELIEWLENCKTNLPVRGFHNENLLPDLLQHKKVMEVLGNTAMITPTPKQLSGLGFNSTVK